MANNAVKIGARIRHRLYSTVRAVDFRIGTGICGSMSTHHLRRVAAKRPRPNCIARLRRQRGWRQRDLAAKVGIHQNEVSAIERGGRIPNVYLARRIARVLGAEIETVFARP